VFLAFVGIAVGLTLALDLFTGDGFTNWIGWVVYTLGCILIFILFVRRRIRTPDSRHTDMKSTADDEDDTSKGSDPRDLQKVRKRIREHKKKGGSVLG
jgi:hypothetical protein